MEQDFSMHANPLVAKLQKPASEFTKADIVSYIKENGITMVNFMYPAADGRLKTLNFVINDAAYLDAILTCGERVDGSSLFPFIEAGSSDLYVIPRFCTAFIDPFAEQPTLSMLCSFFNKDGEPLESSPEHTLRKACRAFTEVTGTQFRVKLLPVAEMLYERYKDMHLSGDRVFPLKGTYNTLNMSLACCQTCRSVVQPDDPHGAAYLCHNGHAYAGCTSGNGLQDAGT